MALDENTELMRKMQAAGSTLVRLSRYAQIGVTPSRENLRKAADYFESVSRIVDDKLRNLEQQAATRRLRGFGMKG